MTTVIRMCTDEDLLIREPQLDEGNGNGLWPRMNSEGEFVRSWDPHIVAGMEKLERRLRSGYSDLDQSKLGPLGRRDQFALGRLSPYSKELLKPAAVCFALHYLFRAADTTADENQYCARKAKEYEKEGNDIIEHELPNLEYDLDDSGTIEDEEEDQPFLKRFIRG